MKITITINFPDHLIDDFGLLIKKFIKQLQRMQCLDEVTIDHVNVKEKSKVWKEKNDST